MSAINFHTKEISVKIVYYGPGLCGKTTSLQTIYGSLPEERRPQLVSLATDVDRTIFFDFLPLTAYRIRDFKVRLQLYTVPGQVFYNATRKLVLNGVDGIVFVADSQQAMNDSNLESLQNLEDNLAELGLELEKVPMVMQFNKRDLHNIMAVEEMDSAYNPRQMPVFATVATTGQGLMDTLKTISKAVVNDLIRKGLGQQLREQSRLAKVEHVPPPPASDSFSKGYATVAEAVTQAARGSMWPAGDVGQLGATVTSAIERGDWGSAVRTVDRLLEYEVHRWATSEGRNPSESQATFLFLRGVSPGRYQAFLQSLAASRAGRAVTHKDAMNALIVALETLW